MKGLNTDAIMIGVSSPQGNFIPKCIGKMQRPILPEVLIESLAELLVTNDKGLLVVVPI